MTFKDDGYLIVKGVLDTKEYYEYALKEAKLGHGLMEDMQAPGSPSFYKDKKMVEIHDKLLTTMEKYTGLKLFKTYTYFRVYQYGAVLMPHTDRPACEISSTLCLGYDAKEPWIILLKDRKGKIIKTKLEAGDMLIYRGCELYHWRDMFTGKNQAQVFLHYVDQNGPYAEHRDDKINEINTRKL